jgi:hypothetical protein
MGDVGTSGEQQGGTTPEPPVARKYWLVYALCLSIVALGVKATYGETHPSFVFSAGLFLGVMMWHGMIQQSRFWVMAVVATLFAVCHWVFAR